MKTNLLFIANIFPPMGGSGVQRSAKFAKYLREFDIEPFVLTRQFDKGITDTSLLSEIPQDIYVERTKPYDYTEWTGALRIPGKIIARKLLIPDGEVTWYKKNLEVAKKMIETHEIQAIYSTSYPYSDHLMGLALKRCYPNLPWIVDFRDEWSMNPYILDKGFSNYRKNKEKKMEEAIAKECDFFIANTPIMHENFLSMYPFLKDKSSVITNGFDSQDFEKIDRTYQRGDKFVIVHPGVIYGNRKIDKILKSIKELSNEGILDIKDIQLKLIGDVKKEDMIHAAKEFGLASIVECPGYLSHIDTIKALVNSEVLLLLLREGVGGRNIAPGKIYEYVNANRNILALAPKDGVSAKIINDTKTGIVCDTINITEIKKGLEIFYTQWKEHSFQLDPDWEAIKEFDRKVLTQKLSMIVKELI